MIANGKEFILPAPITLADFLAQQNYRAQLVAVELNGAIIRREYFTATILTDADKIEVVSFVGGG